MIKFISRSKVLAAKVLMFRKKKTSNDREEKKEKLAAEIAKNYCRADYLISSILTKTKISKQLVTSVPDQ